LRDPTTIHQADYLVVESTYGDRLHSKEDALQILECLIKNAVEEKRVIIVPSFAIGRTQELLWDIHILHEEKRVPTLPIYVDSPMATDTTLLYVSHDEDHDKDMKVHMARGESPLRPDMVHFVRDRSMSKALNRAPGPMMIIAGSGMVNGGRVLHHLRHRLPDPSTIVLFTGYQAEGTRGRDLIEGVDTVRIFGDSVKVNAQIEKLNSLSAHADSEELLRWMSSIKTPPKNVFLVHGDYAVQEAFRNKIVERFGWSVEIPAPGDSYEI
jgi:metallo-beta-lactamase family protein